MKLDRLFIPMFSNSLKTGKKITNNFNIKAMTREEEIDKAGLDWYYQSNERDIDIATAFMMGGKWADAHPHWISVDEELPKINPNDSEWEYSDDVIVALKDGSIAVGRYERDNSTGEHYWVLYGVDKDLVDTHWMPLPQARSCPEFPNYCEKGGEE